MTPDRVFAITWTETALKRVEAIPDPRIRRVITLRVDQLAKSPEQQGKPLAVGRRRSGDKSDIYELASELLSQGLVRW